jgi:GT2 family glycosyltransferase
MAAHDHLLHPELLTHAWPIGGESIATALDGMAAQVAQEPRLAVPVSVMIRTLNEADMLEGLLEDLAQQKTGAEVETIVVDNESTDGTPVIARNFGAEVVTIPRSEFTHPRSLNAGIGAASHDIVFSMVGHSNLTTDQYLHSGLRYFPGNDLMAGVYGATYPGQKISISERLLHWGWAKPQPAERIQKAHIGVFGANSAAIAKPVWEELGRFDERYERGGEDTQWAGKAIGLGREIVREPLMAVHHTHGLGLINTIRQWRQYYRTLEKPEPFDQQQWAKRRPDLNFD